MRCPLFSLNEPLVSAEVQSSDSDTLGSTLQAKGALPTWGYAAVGVTAGGAYWYYKQKQKDTLRSQPTHGELPARPNVPCSLSPESS